MYKSFVFYDLIQEVIAEVFDFFYPRQHHFYIATLV